MATHWIFNEAVKSNSVALHLIPSFCLPLCIHCVPLIFSFVVSANGEHQTASSWKILWKKIILEILSCTGTVDLHGCLNYQESNPCHVCAYWELFTGMMDGWYRNPSIIWMLGVILILQDWDEVERGCALVRMWWGGTCFCATPVEYFMMIFWLVEL